MIEIYVPDLVLDFDTDTPTGEFYVNQIDPEMRKWLCDKIGEPNVTQFKNWTLLRNNRAELKPETYRYVFQLDTTEAIAVEFKLRWL